MSRTATLLLLVVVCGCGDADKPDKKPDAPLTQLESHEFRSKLRVLRAAEGETFGALAEVFVRQVMDQLPSQIEAVIDKHPGLEILTQRISPSELPLAIEGVPGPVPLHLPQRLKALAEAALPALKTNDALQDEITELVLDAALKTLSAAVELVKSAVSNLSAYAPPDAWPLPSKQPKNLYGWLYRMQRRQLSKSSPWDVRIGDSLAGTPDHWKDGDDASTISIGRMFRELLQVPDMNWAVVTTLRYGSADRYSGAFKSMLEETQEAIVQLTAERVRRSWNRIVVGLDDYLIWEFERSPYASATSVRGAQDDRAGPTIEVISPPKARGMRFNVETPTVEVELQVEDPSGVKAVTINGAEATQRDGRYVHTVGLTQASNALEIVALDVHGNTRTFSGAIARKDGEATLQTTQRGKNYALLIGVNDYDHWAPLRNPVNDATTVRDVLRDTYGFETELITNPTKSALQLKVREYIERTFGTNDQLLFFFAGHGHYDVPPMDLGYLVFKDTPMPANDEARNGYLRHDSLLVLLDRIRCPHLLVVLDSCFGGNAFGARLRRVRGATDIMADIDIDELIEDKMKLRTRKLITSGGTEYVWDGPKDEHSPFAYRLLSVLRSLDGKPEGVITVPHIVGAVQMGKPGAISGSLSGDDAGSDFLFVKRRK